MSQLPPGFGLALDPSVLRFDGGAVLVGGRPGRVLRLSPEGVRALDRLLDATVVGDAPTDVPGLARLAGRLVDGGLAHPRPPPGSGPGPAEVTVVVPVRDRPEVLAACLGALGHDATVLVVDDGSADAGAVARVCAQAGAGLVRRGSTGGPASARNDGVAAAGTPVVAFVDSDCIPPAGWLAGLLPHFGDPAVVAVAPRVRPVAGGSGSSRLGRFADAHSPLDMGPDEGLVGPGRAVPYVPTAALVVRREALGAGFDTGLRYGEDVDAVWRLVEDGGDVRYVPEVVVGHREPPGWRATLARRFRYGTSAAPLARRHPGCLAPLELSPWPATGAVAALTGHPGTAAGIVGTWAATLARRTRAARLPAALPLRWAAGGTASTALGAGRAATQLALPALALALARPGRARRAALALVMGPPLVDWWRRRPALGPVTWTVASVADDVAYGAGVWAGCLRERTAAPLLPAVRRAWPPPVGARRAGRRPRGAVGADGDILPVR